MVLTACAPASVAALTAATSPRTTAVTSALPTWVIGPASSTLAALSMASVASTSATRPRVSISPIACCAIDGWLWVVSCRLLAESRGSHVHEYPPSPLTPLPSDGRGEHPGEGDKRIRSVELRQESANPVPGGGDEDVEGKPGLRVPLFGGGLDVAQVIGEAAEAFETGFIAELPFGLVERQPQCPHNERHGETVEIT